MASKIVQRLIAAGASPERAQTFETQYLNEQLTKTGQRRIEKSDLENTFDNELAALVIATYPTLYRPPTADSDDFIPYMKSLVTPLEFKKIQNKLQPIDKEALYMKFAPEYARAVNQQNRQPFYRSIIKGIKEGITDAELETYIREDALAFRNKYLTVNADTLVADMKNIYNDYVSATPKVEDAFTTAADTNSTIILKALPPAAKKFYEFQIVDPSYKWGTKTDYNAKTISVDTYPAIEKRIPNLSTLKQMQSTPASSYMKDIGAEGLNEIRGRYNSELGKLAEDLKSDQQISTPQKLESTFRRGFAKS
jgi:hypothetical protein